MTKASHTFEKTRQTMKKNPKIMSMTELGAQMRAVARGEIPAPDDAGEPSFNSVETLTQQRRTDVQKKRTDR